MKNKIAVIYKSKYGSSKRYAGWIALRLDADLYEIDDIRVKDLEEYDMIIYGGGIYIGKINGIKFITKNYDRIKEKKVIVFTVGMESTGENFDRVVKNTFDEKYLENIRVFNFKGSLDYSNLSFTDKILMKGLKLSIDKKSIRELTEDDKLILEGFEREVNLCDKKSIEPLIENI
ncbi:MAG: flavodoxin domain-containing protein [Romboutsia sp.]|uniref:flavodoxin domain-containing protein n=1 Tax=Romboutsia sp. TaxID=1965302 RepID=UPI003F31F442